MEYLHTMIRVTDLKATIAFFELLGFIETRRLENEKGRYTLVFLAAPADAERARKDQAPLIELTYNWDPEVYTGGRNFGHLACGDTQKAVPNMPPQKYSPTLPALGACPGSVRTAKPKPKPCPGHNR